MDEMPIFVERRRNGLVIANPWTLQSAAAAFNAPLQRKGCLLCAAGCSVRSGKTQTFSLKHSSAFFRAPAPANGRRTPGFFLFSSARRPRISPDELAPGGRDETSALGGSPSKGPFNNHWSQAAGQLPLPFSFFFFPDRPPPRGSNGHAAGAGGHNHRASPAKQNRFWWRRALGELSCKPFRQGLLWSRMLPAVTFVLPYTPGLVGPGRGPAGLALFTVYLSCRARGRPEKAEAAGCLIWRSSRWGPEWRKREEALRRFAAGGDLRRLLTKRGRSRESPWNNEPRTQLEPKREPCSGQASLHSRTGINA